MAKQPRPLRAIRIEDELWDAAKRTAESRDETVSDVVRDRLTRYVRTYEPPAPKPTRSPRSASRKPPKQ